MVSNLHNSTCTLRWSKITWHSDCQGQKLPLSKIEFFGKVWPKLPLLTTQISRQKQAKRATTCSSLYFLHGFAEGMDNTNKSSILLMERHFFEVLPTARIDTKKFELWKIERRTKIFSFLGLRNWITAQNSFDSLFQS